MPPRLKTCGQFLGASLAVLIPCFWQSRLQAGDLSSHLYNAWLAQLIQQGRAPGLTLVHQNTNILFDWMLSSLMGALGAGAAQRITVALAVLVFVWGAFGFVSSVAGKLAWQAFPVIAMLAYGWVFHMGFFNFYLSLGLCFGALALCWRPSPARYGWAVPLLAVAYAAHAFPVVWAAGLIAYQLAAGWLSLRLRPYLLVSACAVLVLMSGILRTRMATMWFPTQFLSASGLEQAWVFDSKYLLVLAGVLLLWELPIMALARQSERGKFVSSIEFQFCALTALATLVFPNAVLIPGYKHYLSYIADRMSLPIAVLLCGMAARGPRRAFVQYLTPAVVVAFFAFLYHDERALNGWEDRVEQAVATVPEGERVLNGIDAAGLRASAITHMVDRVCVGRCYSYANYEPSTAQFRVRAIGESPLVASTYKDSWAMQSGTYTVKPEDLPMHLLTLDPAGNLELIRLRAGDQPAIRHVKPW